MGDRGLDFLPKLFCFAFPSIFHCYQVVFLYLVRDKVIKHGKVPLAQWKGRKRAWVNPPPRPVKRDIECVYLWSLRGLPGIGTETGS